MYNHQKYNYFIIISSINTYSRYNRYVICIKEHVIFFRNIKRIIFTYTLEQSLPLIVEFEKLLYQP